jgi:hypothetical protein
VLSCLTLKSSLGKDAAEPPPPLQVLQADGGTRCACINAAMLALADAGGLGLLYGRGHCLRSFPRVHLLRPASRGGLFTLHDCSRRDCSLTAPPGPPVRLFLDAATRLPQPCAPNTLILTVPYPRPVAPRRASPRPAAPRPAAPGRAAPHPAPPSRRHQAARRRRGVCRGLPPVHAAAGFELRRGQCGRA